MTKEKGKKGTKKLEERSVESIQLEKQKENERNVESSGNMYTIKRNNVRTGVRAEVKEKRIKG